MTRTLRRTLGALLSAVVLLTGAVRIARSAGQEPGPFARADELIEKAIEEAMMIRKQTITEMQQKLDRAIVALHEEALDKYAVVQSITEIVDQVDKMIASLGKLSSSSIEATCGLSPLQSTPSPAVTEMKSRPKNTPVTSPSENSASASGEAAASCSLVNSRVPAVITCSPGRNFSVAGLGVVSVSMNMMPTI